MTYRHNTNRALFATLLLSTAIALPHAALAEAPVFEVTVSEPSAQRPEAREAPSPSTAPAAALDPMPTGSLAPADEPVHKGWGAIATAPVDVRATFDGLEARPQLNVETDRAASTAARDEPLAFRGHWNYGAFIERAQVRIHRRGDSADARPLAVIGLDRDGYGEWVPPMTAPGELSYRLRVFDAEGRFDETEATALTLTDIAQAPPLGAEADDDGLDAYGTDRTERRNIPVRGGLVTVSGTNVGPGETVLLNGREVPIDVEGRFVAEEVVPHGVSTVTVAVDGPRPRLIERDVEVPETDFFYVALGELTLGENIRSGDKLRRVNGEKSEVDLTGRGAVYLKGRVKGDVLITASADTREGEMDELFRGLRSRDARTLLSQIDPDRFYPVYGDDSSIERGAGSTTGLYVRIERDDSFIQYGNYSVAFEESELARLDRGLEGAVAQHRSLSQTSFGERKREVTVYAARNETVPAYETFLGTGGTIFLLRRQDLVIGSERLTVEVRDRTSGLVTSTIVLQPGRDYTIDPVAGRVRLSRPLSARVADGGTVRAGSLRGDDLYLVARYEYVPGEDELEGYNVGGRAQAWLGDHLRLGATGQSEVAGSDERRQLLGADLVLRHSPGTYVKGEIARSEGPGFGTATSIDGGFSFDNASTGAATGEAANAYRAEAAIDLRTLMRGTVDGQVTGYVEHFERGFTGQRLDVVEDTTRYGGAVRIEPTERVALGAAIDVIETDAGRRLVASADADVDVTERITASLGVRHDDVSGELTPADSALTPAAPGSLLGTNLRRGSRTDVAVEVAYEGGEDWNAYAFGQATAQLSGDRERNDRGGVGGEFRLNDRMIVGGEVSAGSGGPGGELRVTYEGDDDVTVDLGYGYTHDLAADETRISRNYTHALNARTTKRYSDHLSVFSEGRLGFTRLSEGRDLAQAYGVELAPSERWAMTALVERGDLFELEGTDLERTSGSATLSYRGDKLNWSGTVEARLDERTSDGSESEGRVLAARSAVSYRPNESWTLHGTAEWVEASGDQTAVLDSDYAKLVAAAAYRPVEHDRVNTLVKYVYLSDLSPIGQLSGTGVAAQPKQRSHVVSADAIVDVAPWLSVGAKYALRHGEVSLDRSSDAFLTQTAQLAILRADVHVTEYWDLMAEGRVLDVADTDTLLGGVVGVWRQVGKVKVGGGYSFSSFSDDITDLTYDDHGWFVNVAAAL